MAEPPSVVTGAFGFTGRYIARYLLAHGTPVITLVAHANRPNPFGDRVRVAPLSFDQPSALAEAMAGATTLYNTYWVRFNRANASFERAVENTCVLLQAAGLAGVRRVVHISVSNPAAAPQLPYFAGKLQVEAAVRACGLSYAIVRPTLIFGDGDILINNIGWLLRRLPAFGVPGRGDYRLQPVYAEDVADLAVKAAQGSDNFEIDAAGPETYTFVDLVRRVAAAVGSRARLVHVPPGLAVALASVIGWAVRDVVITLDEIAGLMANLLVSHAPATAHTSFAEWLAANAARVGRHYASELARHFPDQGDRG